MNRSPIPIQTQSGALSERPWARWLAILSDSPPVEVRGSDYELLAGEGRSRKLYLAAEAGSLVPACASRGSYTPGDATAHVHVVLQEHEEAMRELDRAYDEHSSSLHFIGIAPEFAPLRPDKRFVSIVNKIGLEPEKVFAANKG